MSQVEHQCGSIKIQYYYIIRYLRLIGVPVAVVYSQLLHVRGRHSILHDESVRNKRTGRVNTG